MNRVVVEDSLSNIKNALKNEGFEILNQAQMTNCDAIVLTGLDNNTMNMQDTLTKAPVINADGRTAEEVVKEVKQKLNYQQRTTI